MQAPGVPSPLLEPEITGPLLPACCPSPWPVPDDDLWEWHMSACSLCCGGGSWRNQQSPSWRAQTLILHSRYTGVSTAARIGTTAGHSGPFGNDFVYLKVCASYAPVTSHAPVGLGLRATQAPGPAIPAKQRVESLAAQQTCCR